MRRISLFTNNILFVCFAIALSANTIVKADTTLPQQQKVWMPGDFKQSEVWRESKAFDFLQRGDYGQKKEPREKNHWDVYSDREDNVTYTSPNGSVTYDKLSFNERVRIADIKNGYALVYTEPRPGVIYPRISADARSRGWIPMDNLLLWPSAMADDHDIYQKALIVANLDNMNRESSSIQNCYLNPELKNDRKYIKPISTDMTFYFVMKRTREGYALLSKQYMLGGQAEKVLVGWVSPESFTAWNQRSCLEPNWNPTVVDDMKRKGEKANVFVDQSMSNVVAYFQFGVPNEEDQNEQTHYRLPKDVLRYPILETFEDCYKCTAFTYASGNMNEAIKTRHELESKKRELLLENSRVNIILILDATKSMIPYYPKIAEAIRKSAENFRENANLKVGIVLYRDYEDGEFMIEKQSMLPINDQRIYTFLTEGGRGGIGQKSNDKTHREALFQGLNYALNNSEMQYGASESNLFLVVGDCGNDDAKDKKHNFNATIESLTQRMVENNVQLMAFQVDSKEEVEWQDFQIQMGQFVYDVMNTRYRKWSTKIKTSRINQDGEIGYDVIPADDIHRIYSGALRHAQGGKILEPNTLTKLMDRNIGNFSQAVSNQANIINDIDEELARISSTSATTATSDVKWLVEKYGERNVREWISHGTMLAKEGFAKKISKSGENNWNPVVFISEEELNGLLEHLLPVYESSRNSTDRHPYIEAMKDLLKVNLGSRLSDAEMNNMSVDKIMNMINGLNARTTALGSYTLEQIGDPHKVKDTKFRELVTDFKTQYNKLAKMKQGDYKYKWETNGVTYYWIPIEDMP